MESSDILQWWTIYHSYNVMSHIYHMINLNRSIAESYLDRWPRLFNHLILALMISWKLKTFYTILPTIHFFFYTTMLRVRKQTGHSKYWNLSAISHVKWAVLLGITFKEGHEKSPLTNRFPVKTNPTTKHKKVEIEDSWTKISHCFSCINLDRNYPSPNLR